MLSRAAALRRPRGFYRLLRCWIMGRRKLSKGRQSQRKPGTVPSVPLTHPQHGRTREKRLLAGVSGKEEKKREKKKDAQRQPEKKRPSLSQSRSLLTWPNTDIVAGILGALFPRHNK